MGVNIGQASKASGLSERMIRYFEKQGLISTPERSGGGYRSYGEADVRRMRTIALAQDVGFTTEAITRLLSMMDDAQRADPEAEARAMADLDRREEAIAELRGRINGVVDRARSRLEASDIEIVEEDEIDWRPRVERHKGPTIVIEKQPANRSCRSDRERDLTTAD